MADALDETRLDYNDDDDDDDEDGEDHDDYDARCSMLVARCSMRPYL